MIVQRGEDFMTKCHGQRDQHDGDPHPDCIDVRREQS